MITSRLKAIRQKQGYSQRLFADKLNIKATTYNQYEAGNRKTPASVAEDIAKKLNVDIDDIFLPANYTLR